VSFEDAGWTQDQHVTATTNDRSAVIVVLVASSVGSLTFLAGLIAIPLISLIIRNGWE
jgi:hypothetical protein